jgi:hypothetical protein
MFEIVGDEIWFNKERVAVIVPKYDGVLGAELKAALDLHDADYECEKCEKCEECEECEDMFELRDTLIRLMRAGSFSQSQIEEFELIYESSI